MDFTCDKDDRPDEVEEWTPPNLCPCGSGKLYRDCHGARLPKPRTR